MNGPGTQQRRSGASRDVVARKGEEVDQDGEPEADDGGAGTVVTGTSAGATVPPDREAVCQHEAMLTGRRTRSRGAAGRPGAHRQDRPPCPTTWLFAARLVLHGAWSSPATSKCTVHCLDTELREASRF